MMKTAVIPAAAAEAATTSPVAYLPANNTTNCGLANGTAIEPTVAGSTGSSFAPRMTHTARGPLAAAPASAYAVPALSTKQPLLPTPSSAQVSPLMTTFSTTHALGAATAPTVAGSTGPMFAPSVTQTALGPLAASPASTYAAPAPSTKQPLLPTPSSAQVPSLMTTSSTTHAPPQAPSSAQVPSLMTTFSTTHAPPQAPSSAQVTSLMATFSEMPPPIPAPATAIAAQAPVAPTTGATEGDPLPPLLQFNDRPFLIMPLRPLLGEPYRPASFLGISSEAWRNLVPLVHVAMEQFVKIGGLGETDCRWATFSDLYVRLGPAASTAYREAVLNLLQALRAAVSCTADASDNDGWSLPSLHRDHEDRDGGNASTMHGPSTPQGKPSNPRKSRGIRKRGRGGKGPSSAGSRGRGGQVESSSVSKRCKGGSSSH